MCCCILDYHILGTMLIFEMEWLHGVSFKKMNRKRSQDSNSKDCLKDLVF